MSNTKMFLRMFVLLIYASCTMLVYADSGGLTVTASSEYWRDNNAQKAMNRLEGIDSDFWSTLPGMEKKSWWQIELPKTAQIEGVTIYWANYKKVYHCPPICMDVQVSDTGQADSFKTVRTITADELPTGGQPYDKTKFWHYTFNPTVKGRFLRLAFPQGGQTGYAGNSAYVCLGEVKAQFINIDSKIVTLSGGFGEAQVNVVFPEMTRLYLQGPQGLTHRSVLAYSASYPANVLYYPNPVWVRGGYSYVISDGKRYESFNTKAGHYTLTEDGDKTVLDITDIKLCNESSGDVIATEDWTLTASKTSEQLSWHINRRWQKDCNNIELTGSPALFFHFNPRTKENSVTGTFWYDPLRLESRPNKNEIYDITTTRFHPRMISLNHFQTFRDRDASAVFKLWDIFHSPVDIRFEVDGGYLYRRGSFLYQPGADWYFRDIGTATKIEANQHHTSGEIENISLKISPVEKSKTGYQLAIDIPDEQMESSLCDFYQSVFNGGAINDQKGYSFGNGTDSWYYAGNIRLFGAALFAGVPATDSISSQSYLPWQAFRENLAHILTTMDQDGILRFGYNQSGKWVDDGLHTISGMRYYLLHSGDLNFIRQNLSSLECVLEYYIQRRNADGLFFKDQAEAHWYYDWVKTSGVNGYYNAFFYKALLDLAEMETAMGFDEKAQRYRQIAVSVKEAYNRVLWTEDAPEGPRYADWIDLEGNKVTYFCDICQWPAIAVGIASPQQAQKIIATADKRIKVLVQQEGYPETAGLAALWPIPDKYIKKAWGEMPWGTYFNGGSLLMQTYWEVVARAKTGDTEGAYRRLKKFAEGAAQEPTSYVGANHINIQGEPLWGTRELEEPYLADMVTTTASLTLGILGIEPTWDQLRVRPNLPAAWSSAQTEVIYKGRKHRITINNGQVDIKPLEQVIDVPLLWVMDFNLKTHSQGTASVSNAEFTGAYDSSVELAKNSDGDYVTSGSYQTPAFDWKVAAQLKAITIAANLNGGQIMATVETSHDGFKTVCDSTKIVVTEDVSEYSLEDISKAAQYIRVKYDFIRGQNITLSPILDGFRITAQEHRL